MKKQKAFTVIELLVVLAIVGLIASIVLINLRDSKDKAEIAKVLQYSGSVKNALGAYIVGEWRFEDNFDDTSGKENHATNHGVVFEDNDASTELGRAGDFNGSSYIDCGTSNELTPEDITIETWVKAENLDAWDGIVSNMSSWGTGFSLQIGTTQNIAAMVSGSYLRTSWQPTTNTWYHIVATHDSSTNLNVLYVNGKEENRSTRAIVYEPNPETYIGVFYTSPSIYFDGIIDEVRIYNEALDVAQIRKLYAKGFMKHLTNNNLRP